MANTFVSALESAQSTAVEMTEGFSGNVRALGATFLEEGDIFRIPNDFKVFKNTELSRPAEGDRKAVDVLFTVAEMFDDAGNDVGGKQIYPGIFNRTVYHWHKDEAGKLVNMHKTFTPSGKPVTDYNSEKLTQEAMKKIAGKKIRVVKIDPIETRNFDRTDTTTQSVYTFEYVD